jgi:hypothetical protein
MSPAEIETNTAPQFLRIMPRLLIGLTILCAGLLWTLDNLNVLESERITQWWPAVVIVIGALRLFDPAANKVTSVIIALAGVGLLLDTLDYWDFDPGDFFPLAIALIGAKLVSDVFRRRPATRANGGVDADSVVHSFAFMAGVGKRSVSHDYRGGDANAIMGGVELDLREARIAPGQEAVLDAFAFWGGVEIKVPESWRVVSQVMPLMGAYEDNTASKGGGSGPTLVIRGVAIMGAIEVKN